MYEALDKDPTIEIGKVKYIDFSKRFSSINGSFWYKRKAFEHEREVRAITTSHQAHSGIEKAVDLDKLISAVYISPYAPKWFEDVVRDVMQKYELILSILVYTFFSRMFDLMLPPVAKHSIVVA